MANFSTNSELLAVLSCSPLSPSNLRISIIQQSYGLAIASTELCELVSEYLLSPGKEGSIVHILTSAVHQRPQFSAALPLQPTDVKCQISND